MKAASTGTRETAAWVQLEVAAEAAEEAALGLGRTLVSLSQK